ncbi:hypothetical protein PHMEG_00037344, partial [Phytophthora megakarya]
MWERIRPHGICTALTEVGLLLSDTTAAPAHSPPSLNKPLQRVLSAYIRRTQVSLSRFVELLRGHAQVIAILTPSSLLRVLGHLCRSQHYQRPKVVYPTNHKSAADRYAVLVRNIRKEQDRWRCLVVDLDILEIWPEVHVSPFGVVDKGDADPQTSGRTIHDLSFSTGRSINDFTDTDNICTSTFENCDIIVREILRQKPEMLPLPYGTERAHLFGERLEKDNALVINTAAAFRWSGSRATYGVI